MTLTPALRDTLASVTTATLTTVLLKRGLRKTWMEGPRPLGSGQARVVGPAFTLRFIPAREDLATPEAWSSPRSTRAAIEAMPEGAVAVAGTEGITRAGIFGDILCARMKRRGIAGLVTEGAVRDAAGVRATGLAVWCAAEAAPPSVAALTFVGWEEPVGCGGVAVFPGDVVVADEDGAVVIPQAIVAEVAREAEAQEKLEAWIMREVERGAALPGLYPPDAATRARYEKETS
ncbi:MAG: ribonuclease activity regulator RraA [Acetobacteraceae bacterium]|nr:ribonuclease activity regulator RraA [Acetobacteraceae bacterium]